MNRFLQIIFITFLTFGLMACSPSEGDVENNTVDNSSDIEEQDDNTNESIENEDQDDDIGERDNDRDNKNNEREQGQKASDQTTSIENGKGGYLWRVENDDTTVYLQGTIHIGTKDFYPLNHLIEEAYESADVVVPEIDITEVDIMSSLGATFVHGIYSDGTTVKDHISPEVYEKLTFVLEKYDLPIDLVGFFKPWMLEAVVTQMVALELDFFHGIDMYFLERAKEDGKEIIELESVNNQYSILAGTSHEFQERQLKATLDSLEDFESSMLEVFALFLEGDPDQLHDSLFPDESEMDIEYQAYMKALNDDRNIKMAEKIIEFLEDGSGKTYFVIVGAAHLIKDPHIRMFLEDAGYAVEHIY